MKPTREVEEQIVLTKGDLFAHDYASARESDTTSKEYIDKLISFKDGFLACFVELKKIDNWRGPEERPEDGEAIKCYYDINGRIFPGFGRYYNDERLGAYFQDEHEERNWWHRVICWQPIDFGPMPERFKLSKSERPLEEKRDMQELISSMEQASKDPKVHSPMMYAAVSTHELSKFWESERAKKIKEGEK